MLGEEPASLFNQPPEVHRLRRLHEIIPPKLASIQHYYLAADHERLRGGLSGPVLRDPTNSRHGSRTGPVRFEAFLFQTPGRLEPSYCRFRTVHKKEQSVGTLKR